MRTTHASVVWLTIVSLWLPGNFSASNAASADSQPTTENSISNKHEEDGWQAFQRGALDSAVASWLEAARIYQEAGNVKQQIKILTYLAQAYQSLGQYKNSLKALALALVLAEKSADRAKLALVKATIGNLYIATGPAAEAFRYLNDALELAREVDDRELTAIIQNNRGNLLASEKNYPSSIAAYTESATMAKEIGKDTLAANASINAAAALIQSGQPNEAIGRLEAAVSMVNGLPYSTDKVFALITIALAYNDLHRGLTDKSSLYLQLAANTLIEAVNISEQLGDRRGQSYALGYLGKLYEDEHRYDEALRLTRRAVFSAQEVGAPESLYRWQWQTGRLLRAQGNIDDAISAYRRAVLSLQSVRQEMSRAYGSSRSSFRESVGPLYFELVDLLLSRAAMMQKREEYEPYLLEARNSVELLKAAELRDYFRDDCVDEVRSRIKRLDVIESAVVVYPIILPDRLELLVNLPTGLKRFPVRVRADRLTEEVRAFRKTLEKRTTREYLPHARQLYQWLIDPLQTELKSLNVGTLVFVPDGPLRTIPMAALHDGEKFLVSKYALATTPGLDLTDPHPIKRERVKVLTAGVSDSVQGFPPLPFVPNELDAIKRLFGGDRLLNQEFLVAALEKKLQDQKFNVVHIASHGEFAGEVEKTFLLTFDDKLTMDRLDQYVGLFRFRDDPLELLVLSACETAAGDDRAALGLAGIAIKAGARSALATLWVINDESTSILVTEFYRQLQDPGVSRAVALQRAQMKLLEDKRYQHPGYWSPFLLINNWL
jgi:CHAT domain-containing protein